MTTATITWTKTQEATPMGEYKVTAIDDAKANADLLLIQVCPKVVQSNIQLKGRGIKAMGQGLYQVTDAACTCRRA